jgi:hypothetical protein
MSVQESAQSPTPTSESQPRQRHPAKVWIGRAGGVLFGVLLAWFLAEVLLRLLFFSLPPRMQLVLNQVHKTPFTTSKLLPDPIWQPDQEYLMITRPVHNYTEFGSAEVRFKVSTETLWGSRVAFRTRQELVDRYVDGVAVGDSFTFCFTDEDECWVQRLGQLLNRNLINLGIVSTGSVSHERVLAHFGMPLKPPLVIWQWFGNDSNEDYGLASLRGETTVVSPNPSPQIAKPSWWGKNSAVYVLLRLYLGSKSQFDASLQFLDAKYARKGSIRLAFGQPYLWNAFDMSLPNNLDGWARGQQAFLESRDMIEGYGGTLVIILMPTKEQVYRDLSEPLLGEDRLALLDQPYQMMLDFCQQQGLTCIDLLPVLQKYAAAGEQLYYTTDMHLNARGNEVLAQELAAWLGEHPEIFNTKAS